MQLLNESVGIAKSFALGDVHRIRVGCKMWQEGEEGQTLVAAFAHRGWSMAAFDGYAKHQLYLHACEV